jgi:voltage-gated potassium channel
MADAVASTYIVPFVNDLLSSRGRVDFQERAAEAHEVGRWSNAVPGALVIGLVRDGRLLSFYEDPPCLIEPGDVLLVIQSIRARVEPPG